MLCGRLNSPGTGAGLAPRHDALAVLRVLVDLRVAVAVRHVDLVVGRQRGVRAAAERLAAHERRGLAGNADGQQHLAFERALADRVIVVVGQVDRVVRPHVDAVRALEDALAPRAQHVAVLVEDDDRMVAAVKRVDLVLAIDADGRDVVQIPSVGPLRPAFDSAVGVVARAKCLGQSIFPQEG